MSLRRKSWITLSIIGAISLFFLGQLPNVRFDYDLQKFFPAGDPETIFFEQYRQKFGNDDDYFLIGIRRKAGVFDSLHLSKVHSLSQNLTNFCCNRME